MSKFEIITMIFMIGYVLDKLYLLPITMPLDTKPDNQRSAAYLAKNIAKEAHCEILQPLRISYQEKETVLNIECLMTDHYFDIYIFLNDKKRNEWIQSPYTINPFNNYKMPCFKQGTAYMICEAEIPLDREGKPIFRGQKYYNNFPGTDIKQKEH